MAFVLRHTVSTALAIAMAALVASLTAQSTADAFLETLQRHLLNDDRRAVAAMIQFPITVSIVGTRIPFADAAALLPYYDTIFTAGLRAAISAPGRTQAPDGTLTRGPITIRPVDGGFTISRIEVWSLAPPPAAKPAPARADPDQAEKRRGPERVIARAGRAAAQVSGALAPGQRASYLLWVEKGQLLDARIERVREREIVLHVLDRKTRTPLDARARDGARVWTGRVTVSGDYQIDVVRQATTGEPALPYWLSIGVR